MIKYHPVEGLGTEYLETCAQCGRRFNLLDMRLDGDGQFRCLEDSFGPNPRCIAEANSLLADYFARKPELMAQIEGFTHLNRDLDQVRSIVHFRPAVLPDSPGGR